MTVEETDKVFCRNPDPAKEGTNVPRWKYDVVRRAILDTLGDDPGGVTFRELTAEVRGRLSAETIERLGSVSWHTTVVKLHLETVSEIERIPDSRPHRLRRCSAPE